MLRGTDPRSCSVADRVAWAEGRETSRPEDLAYSLLGLIDISMPIIYGEGQNKAFLRLKKEIETTKLSTRAAADFTVSEFIEQLGGRRALPNGGRLRQNMFSPWAADTKGVLAACLSFFLYPILFYPFLIMTFIFAGNPANIPPDSLNEENAWADCYGGANIDRLCIRTIYTRLF